MTAPDLTGKRVLILGAETEIGRAVTTAVAEAGASVAAVAATTDAEAAFAVQRLARRLSSPERKIISLAIDATNEAAVRVMVRQVSKELSGLDAVVFAADLWTSTIPALHIAAEFGEKEIRRTGRGAFVTALPVSTLGPASARDETDYGALFNVPTKRRTLQQITNDVLHSLAEPID
jgi:NAD(P)-dependent dehydrogenase (short-subunit alcohol dehydrogenase family)